MANNGDIANIIREFGSDKGCQDGHSYASWYDDLFSSIRSSVRSVLEIGVLHGKSLRAWHKCFSGAHIYGVDIERQRDLALPADRTTYIDVDCRNPRDLFEKVATFGPFDICIDDGDHVPLTQVATFAVLYPQVRSGGFYIIEDLQRIDDAIAIAKALGGELIDRRNVVGRSDDVLILWRKP